MTDDEGGRPHLRLMGQPPADRPGGPEQPANGAPDRPETAIPLTIPPGAWLSLHDLTGSVAMVTGSATGLDLAIVTALADFGARVVVAQRDIDRARFVAQHASRQATGGAVAVGLDPAQPVQLRRGISAVEHLTRRIDLLIVLADLDGVLQPRHADTLTMPELVATIRAVERRMAVLGGGRILIVASGLPRDPAVGTMAQGAITAFVQTTAPVFQVAGVTINGILTGLTGSPVTEMAPAPIAGAAASAPGSSPAPDSAAPGASDETETETETETTIDSATPPTDDAGVIPFPVTTNTASEIPPADAAAVISGMLGLIGPAMQQTTGQVLTVGRQ